MTALLFSSSIFFLIAMIYMARWIPFGIQVGSFDYERFPPAHPIDWSIPVLYLAGAYISLLIRVIWLY